MKKKEMTEHMVAEPLRIGEQIGISTDGERLYPTLLEDITEDNRLIVSVPIYRGIPIIIKVDQHLRFFFFRENGRFCIDVLVEEIIMQGPLRLIALAPLSEPLKQQRRNSFRLRIGLSALIRPYGGGLAAGGPYFEEEDMIPWEDVITNNLSETGVSLNSVISHKTGDCLQLKITLDHDPHHLEEIELLGIVRQVQALENLSTQYRLGVEFLPYSDKLRQLIAKFVMKKQQQIIRAELELDNYL
jgi:c-di-GMP-binding flagellar brake protein YcgR